MFIKFLSTKFIIQRGRVEAGVFLSSTGILNCQITSVAWTCVILSSWMSPANISIMPSINIHKKPKVLIDLLALLSFCSIAIRFRVTRYFATSAPNDPKMTLNTKMSKIHHILVTITPNTQLPAPFCFTASFFPYTGHFEPGPLNDSLKTLKEGLKGTTYMLQLQYPWLLNFSLLHFTASPFRDRCHFWDTCTEWSQTDFES